MEKVLNSFKNLYKGEGVVSKHLALISLFILPALLSGVRSLVDKDTPKDILLVAGIAAVILFVLSIVPFLWILGYYVRYAENKLMGNVGIPKVDFEMLMEGVKVFPLTLVWGIYFAAVTITILILPFLPLIGAHSKSDIGGAVIIMILGLLLAFTVILAIAFLVFPFYNYILVEYVKYGHQGYLYNPATLVEFMKRGFSDTIIVVAKFFVAALIIGIPMFFIQLIAGGLIFAQVVTLFVTPVIYLGMDRFNRVKAENTEASNT